MSAHPRAWRLSFSDLAPGSLPSVEDWDHRFADSARAFRTRYCAHEQITCLRETLANLRPNPLLVDTYQETFGESDLLTRASVTGAFRRRFVLQPVQIVCTAGPLIAVDIEAIRQKLEREHRPLMDRHGLTRLDLSQLGDLHREVSQIIARYLFDQGAGGIIYRSRLDGGACVALFAGRTQLIPDGDAIPLTEAIPALSQVCAEYGLTLVD